MRPLLSESNLWRELCESQPLQFFDRQLLPAIAYAIRQMAQLIKCPPEELLPLQNVTAGRIINLTAPFHSPRPPF
jgi:hypothetical protein